MQKKTVVITGGANGIGKKTAELFVEAGSDVVIADYDEEAGEKAAEEIGVEFYQVDVSDLSAVQEMFNYLDEKWEELNIVINNAGITADGFLVKMDESDWDRVIDVNLKGVFNCGREAAKRMLDQESGVIINASSVVGVYGNVGQTNYAASKFGVVGLTKTWAKELGAKGVRVNAVAPGFVNTDMVEDVPDKILDNIRDDTPLARLGEPEEIAEAYFYLASDKASYVNGTVLNVDGGLVL